MWKKRENWLFLFAALGAVAALTKILEYFGVTLVKQSAGVNVNVPPSNITGHLGTLLWALLGVAFSFGLSIYGLVISARKQKDLEARLLEKTSAADVRDGIIT